MAASTTRGLLARFAVPVVLALTVAASCPGCARKAPARTLPGTTRVVERGSFTVAIHGQVEDGLAEALLLRLQSEAPRILADFGLASAEPCAIHVRADPSDYLATMEKLIHGRYPGATGYIAGRNRVELLFWNGTLDDVVHEYAHTQSLRLNPRLYRGPRWLWESLAVYEAAERVDPRSLWYLGEGRFPSLAELNEDVNEGGRVYEVGWLVVDFIKRTWGWKAVLDLARTGGDVEAVLGIGEGEFERRLSRDALAMVQG